jgi:hypothetical protein
MFACIRRSYQYIALLERRSRVTSVLGKVEKNRGGLNITDRASGRKFALFFPDPPAQHSAVVIAFKIDTVADLRREVVAG